jgi:HisJ family histidinol phosphate phosphatase
MPGNPYLRDYHCHTVYSGHSSPAATVENMVQAASESGLDVVAIVEHAPALPRGIPTDAWRHRRGEREHLDRIADSVEALRPRYPDLRILIGAEIDADPWAMDGTLMVENFDRLDLILVATHVLPGGFGFWFEPVVVGDDDIKARMVGDWFDWVEAIVRRDPVDILPHFGCEIAARHLIDSFADPLVTERVDRLAPVMAEEGVACELNESLLYKLPHACAASYPLMLKRMRDHGVKFVCGSDSHAPVRIGHYAWVMELCDNAGLTMDDFAEL